MLPKIKMGTEFFVKVPAIGKTPIKVKVDYISAMGNFATWRATKIRGDFDLKTFEVHAKPTESNPNLRAGMSVIADWNKIKD
jgi:HlyD family secretion protein